MDIHHARLIDSADIDQLLSRPGSSNRWQPDCACEVSNVSLLPESAAPPAAEVVARPCPGLYQDGTTVAPARIVFNPFAGVGISVLNAAAAQILDLVDGVRDAAAIAACLPGDPGRTLPTVLAVLRRMVDQRLVYTTAAPPQPTPRPPTHLGVWLHITNQCNLRCTYCYISKTNEQLPVARGHQALRAVFDAARPQGITDLTLKYAGGEALLEAETIWELDAAARRLAAADIAVRSIILTNGTPLRPALIDQLRARDFQLAISLDGLGAAHDAQRPFRGGQPSFRQVQQGIERARGAGLDVSISVVVGPDNLPTLPALIDYLLDRELRFSLTFLRDNAAASVHLAAQDQALIAGMEAVYARIAARPPAFSLMNAALDRVQLEHAHFAACGIGESYVVIKHSGEIASCQMLLAQPIGHIRAGNILQQVAQRTRERPHGTTVDDHEGCNTCQWKYRCAGGCPVVTFQTYNRFDRRSPFCGAYKALIPRLIALEGLRIARYGGGAGLL